MQVVVDLEGVLIATEYLERNNIKEMYTLFSKHYDNTSLEIFKRDLSNKNWIIALREIESKRIRGFSTLAFYEFEYQNRKIGVAFSGDTIIQKEYWGSTVFPKSWLRNVLELAKNYPQPTYWFLISSGYRTYKTLPVLFKNYYPRHDRATPSKEIDLMNMLAKHRFGADYQNATGIVTLSSGSTPLKSGVATINSKKLDNPYIKYFVDRNPGHSNGDELVCLTELHRDNLTRAGLWLLR